MKINFFVFLLLEKLRLTEETKVLNYIQTNVLLYEIFSDNPTYDFLQVTYLLTFKKKNLLQIMSKLVVSLIYLLISNCQTSGFHLFLNKTIIRNRILNYTKSKLYVNSACLYFKKILSIVKFLSNFYRCLVIIYFL